MAELDQWTRNTVVDPLYQAWREYFDSFEKESDEDRQARLGQAVLATMKAIREKVLESYRNGQKAGPSKPKSAAPRA